MAFVIPLIVSLFLAYILSFYDFFRRMRKFWVLGNKLPGPEAHPLIGNADFFHNVKPYELGPKLKKLAKETLDRGEKIFRINVMGELHVYLLDGNTVGKILESTTELNKSITYDFIKPWLGKGLLLGTAGPEWRKNRKMLTPAFHFAKLDGYIEVFNSESMILIDILDGFAKSGKTVDLFPYFKRYALDVICETAMGSKVDAQHNHDHKYVRSVEGLTAMWIKMFTEPWYMHPLLFWAYGYKKEFVECLSVVKNFTRNVITERRDALKSGEVEKQTSKKMMNFLDLLLSLEETENLSSEYIQDEVDTFMFAGHDTTSSSTSWACWIFAHHPEIQERIYNEMVEIVGEDPNAEITLEHINKMEYFDRCLKECKRLIPPVSVVNRKLVKDIVIDGHLIPSESSIGIPMILIHANHKVYKNPDIYDPDRFLPEEVAKRSAYDFIPFSAGLRNCIGQKFAQYNEKVMLSYVLRNYKLEPTMAFEEARMSMDAVAKPTDGIPVKLIKR